jgi:outer membrane protein assembly factor BamE (lipoprotein component of BamABCDE complex)
MARTGSRAARAALALLTLSACTPEVSNHGYRFDEAALAQLEPGRTTRDGALELLGSPSAVSTFDSKVWYYVSQRTEHMSFYQDEVVEQKVIEVTFDDRDVVQTIARRSLDDAREVAFVDRETPTSGNELNALQQFLGNIGRFNPEGEEGAGSGP